MSPRLNLSTISGFPGNLESNGKISSISYFEASSEVIGIIENFGKLFRPVVQDMRGNLDRLLAYYHEDKKHRKYLEDMVLNDHFKVTHSWLLWLNRALSMIEKFFYLLLNDEDTLKENSDNITHLINKAYDEVLKPYHGFLLQNAFKVSFINPKLTAHSQISLLPHFYS